MLEKEVEKYFVKELRQRNCLVWKFTSPGTLGVPDRVVIFPTGDVAFVELKAPGEQLRDIQAFRRKQLTHRNAICWVIDSKEQVDKFTAVFGLKFKNPWRH